MERRSRRRNRTPLYFQAALAAGLLLWFAVLGIPRNLGEIVLAVATAAMLAVVVVVAIGILRAREKAPYYAGAATPPAPPPADAAASAPATDADPPWKQKEAIIPDQVDATRWNLELLKRLEWRRFEELCAGYFEALEFKPRTTDFGADGDIDLALFAGDAEQPAILVQCQAWRTQPVGIREMRELRGVMAAGKVDEGVFVTAGAFTQEARDFAKGQNIQLIDGNDLIEMIDSLAPEKADALLRLATQGDYRSPTCPACGIKMVERTSKRDGRRFWGCVNFPRCQNAFYSASAPPAPR